MAFMPLLAAIITVALPLALIIGVLRARRTGTATPMVRIALIASATWAGLTLLGAILVTVLWFTPDVHPWFELRTQQYWPAEPTDATGVLPGVVAGGFTTARVGAAGLSMPSRVILATGDLFGSLVTVALASLIALACLRLMQERPFAPELARLSAIAAAICLVGGFGSQILLQWGGSVATGEIIRAGSAPAGLEAATGLSLDFWPLFAAIGLSAFAVLLRYGRTLQRETEGLV